MASYKLSVVMAAVAAFVCVVSAAPVNDLPVTPLASSTSDDVSATFDDPFSGRTFAPHAVTLAPSTNVSGTPSLSVVDADNPASKTTTRGPSSKIIKLKPDHQMQADPSTDAPPPPSSAYQLLPSALGVNFTAFMSLRSISTEDAKLDSDFFVGCVISISILLVPYGYLSSLTVLSYSVQDLQLLSQAGTATERLHALKVLPIRRRGNYLLCTILIWKAIIGYSISMLFGYIATTACTIALASATTVIVGEVLPQMLLARHGLSIASRTHWMLWAMLVTTAPLAYPIAKLMDVVMGRDLTEYHRNNVASQLEAAAKLELDLASKMHARANELDVTTKKVNSVMTKLDSILMLPASLMLNTTTKREIDELPYRRIPIYSERRDNIVGMLHASDLSDDDNITLKAFCIRHPRRMHFVSSEDLLLNVLHDFKTYDFGLALVKRPTDGTIVGLLTLDDIATATVANVNEEDVKNIN